MAFSMSLTFVAFVAVIGLAQGGPANSEESINNLAKACRSKVTVTDEEFQEFLKNKVPTTKEEKCLLACVYKAAGVLGDDGLISAEGAHAFAVEKYKDDADKQALLIKAGIACEKVNSEEVSDGNEGCERAALNLECMLKENKDIVTGLE